MKKVAQYGISPLKCNRIPFEMAPIACSLTPNLTFRSAGVFFWKSPNIFIRVMLDEAKSALPPIRPGNVLARAFRQVWDRLRVASPGFSGVKLCNHPPGVL
jgi:hypothetical protein